MAVEMTPSYSPEGCYSGALFIVGDTRPCGLNEGQTAKLPT
jgi:hypothetical protein